MGHSTEIERRFTTVTPAALPFTPRPPNKMAPADEMLETLGVAVYRGGGQSMMYAAIYAAMNAAGALDAFDRFAAKDNS